MTVALRSLIIVGMLLGASIGALLAGEERPNVADDPLARLMLAYTHERAAKSIGAEVVISGPVSHDQLEQIGMANGSVSDSSRGLYLVVIQGDLDVAGMAPGWGRFTGSQPAAYIAYVFDTVRTPDGRLEMGPNFLMASAGVDADWPDWAHEHLSASP